MPRPSASPQAPTCIIARRAKGEYAPLASPDEAAAYPYAPIDRERIARQRARLVVGGIETVMKRLAAAD